MNGYRWQRNEEADYEELAALLPAPDAPALGPGRHRELREGIVREVDRQRREGKGARKPAPARWKRRVAVAVVPLAVMGLAVTTVTVGDLSQGSSGSGSENAKRSDEAAVQLLDRTAAALKVPAATEVRDDQYLYTRVVGRADRLGGFGLNDVDFFQREDWFAASAKSESLYRTTPLPSLSPSPVAKAPTSRTIVVPSEYVLPFSYTALKSLPSDPDTLLDRLYKETKGQGPTHEEAVIDLMSNMFEVTRLVPDLHAALFRTAIRLPGVRLEDRALDAVGRPGVGLTFEDSAAGQQTWVFDAKKLTFLGTKDAALLNVGVVDKKRDVPHEARPGRAP